jgi:DNA-binding IclR family transcriptional regulator
MAAKDNQSVDSQGRKVLQALSQAPGPLGSKQIGEAAGLDGKLVGDLIKGLKAQGLVESPVRCKWGLTPAGKAGL